VFEDLVLFEYLPKILLAIFCGSLIGLERELKDKPAGMRTYMLICTGATLFTIVGLHFTVQWEGDADPLRVAAQIVTGVGFLGAGTIMFAKGYISGLTSAAAIWMSAAIGMAIGIGLLVLSMVITLLIIISLMVLGKVERTLGLKGRRKYKITVTTGSDSLEMIQKMLLKSGKCDIVEISGTGDHMKIVLDCELSRTEKARLNRALSKVSGDFTTKIE
jgi:putative Mg2+ transporter-C (MgtC) family protein